MKVVKSTASTASVENEAAILSSLLHPRIISLFGFQSKLAVDLKEEDVMFEESSVRNYASPAMFFEYAPYGDLADLIKTVGHFPEIIARMYFKQLIDAVEYLHDKNICHLDIKPDNMLLDANFCVKLADFGFAVKIPEKVLLTATVGSPSYLLPEVHEKQPYNGYEADLFALGVTLFAMFSGKMPFSAAKYDDRLYQLIFQGRCDEFWQHHERLKKQQDRFYSKDFRDLIEQMLAPISKQRLSVQEIKHHPWYRGSTLSDDEMKKLLCSVVCHDKCVGAPAPNQTC